MPDSISPKGAALWFASHGYAVLPLHSVTESGGCTCGDPACESVGKHPFAPIAAHGLRDASVDLGVIRSWFAEHYWLGYGVVTDALLVIDVDARHGGLETWAAAHRSADPRSAPHLAGAHRRRRTARHVQEHV